MTGLGHYCTRETRSEVQYFLLFYLLHPGRKESYALKRKNVMQIRVTKWLHSF